MSKYGIFSGPNTGKYGPEKAPYLDTFHTVGNLKKPNTRRSPSYDANLNILKTYSGILAVTPMLKKDLLQLCRPNAVPPKFYSFCENLTTGTVMGDDPDNIDPYCGLGDNDSDTESE